MKELLDQVAEGQDLKRADVRRVLEEALTQIGTALGEGRDLSLPGLGKLKVKRATRKGDRRVIEARLRQDAPPQGRE
nr:HU family DNA-binding protein [Pseudooceanicola nitratireducens]